MTLDLANFSKEICFINHTKDNGLVHESVAKGTEETIKVFEKKAEEVAKNVPTKGITNEET